jgi:hypothetical protein
LATNLTRNNVVGSRSIDVGIKRGGSNPARPTVESLTETGGFPELQIDGGHPVNDGGPAACGAMSEQHGPGGRGNESTPQELVRLVGCRDSSARNDPWLRPRPVRRKP